MNLSEDFHVAWVNLKANKVRSLFSMLGIVVGTCSVILVVSIVNGTREATIRQMQMGKKDVLILRAKYSESMSRFGRITLEDMDRYKKLPYVQSAFPDISNRLDVAGEASKSQGQVLGIDENYVNLMQIKISSGRNLNSSDTESRSRVALLSERFAGKIFGGAYPIGQRIRLEGLSLEVVGLFKSSALGDRQSEEGDVLLPVLTLLQIMKDPVIYSAQLRAEPGKVDKLKNILKQTITDNPRNADLIDIEDPREYLKDVEKWARTWMIQMVLIAGISLLVGGIGLMNVMLTTVAERTHEIGLRKALGANSKMLLNQFIIESVTLSGLGGGIGVFLGFFISHSLQVLSQGKILVEIMPASLIVSFLFSLVIGLIFGVFPASKASHLSPVEALRYE